MALMKQYGFLIPDNNATAQDTAPH
jgi:hypothetical protein